MVLRLLRKLDFFMKKMILKYTFYCMSFFYFIGAISHYFWLTIFPWYDSALYSPYHDTIITMAAISFMIFFFIIAKNTDIYRQLMYGVSISALLTGFMTLYMAYAVDFSQYKSDIKVLQATVEWFLLLLISGAIYICNKN